MIKMTKTEVPTKEQMIQAVRKIPDVAAAEGWVVYFDSEEGNLYYSPNRVPDGAQLFQVTDDYAVYLDKNFNPKGVMIECFEAEGILGQKIGVGSDGLGPDASGLERELLKEVEAGML